MSPRQMGMSPSFFNEVMQWGQQNGGGQQPGVNPSLPGVRPPQLRVPNGSYSPYGNQMLRPLGPPVPNGGVGGMRGGAASQGGVVMPAQGIRVGYGPAMPPSMPTNGNAPSRGLLMGNVPQQTPQPPAAPAQPPHPQIAMMNRQHENMKLGDQNLPQWQDNVSELNRQAQVMENTQIPERPTGITPQQAFMQIPGNYLTGYQNRFNAIEANRPVAPPAATQTIPGPADRLNQLHGTSLNPNDIKIETPKMVANATLDPRQSAEMQALGNSPAEWEAKAKWLAANGFQSMTPEASQKYADMKHGQRMQLNDRMNAVRARDDAMNNYYNQQKIRRRQQAFQMQNPGLFSNINPVAAQLAYGLGTGQLRQFNESGITPAQALAAGIQNRNASIAEANQWNELGMPSRAEQALQGANLPPPVGMQSTTVIEPPIMPEFSGQRPTAPPAFNPGVAGDRANRFYGESGQIDGKAFTNLLEPAMANNPTPQDLIASGITNQNLDALEESLRRGVFMDSPATARTIGLIRRAREILNGKQSAQTPSAPPDPTSVGVF